MSNSMEDALKKAGIKGGFESSLNKKEETKVIKFYSDDAKTKLKPSLVENEAREWANKFVKKIRGREKEDLTSSQLRRFYGEVLSLEEKLKVTGRQNFEVILPHIKMLKSKAAYASGNRKIPRSFKEFIDVMVDSIEDDPKDFDAFKLIFEAVVGYSIGKGMRQ